MSFAVKARPPDAAELLSGPIPIEAGIIRRQVGEDRATQFEDIHRAVFLAKNLAVGSEQNAPLRTPMQGVSTAFFDLNVVNRLRKGVGSGELQSARNRRFNATCENHNRTARSTRPSFLGSSLMRLGLRLLSVCTLCTKFTRGLLAIHPRIFSGPPFPSSSRSTCCSAGKKSSHRHTLGSAYDSRVAPQREVFERKRGRLPGGTVEQKIGCASLITVELGGRLSDCILCHSGPPRYSPSRLLRPPFSFTVATAPPPSGKDHARATHSAPHSSLEVANPTGKC